MNPNQTNQPMNQPVNQSGVQMNQVPPLSPMGQQPEKKGLGMVLVFIIVLLLLGLGYFFMGKMGEEKMLDETIPSTQGTAETGGGAELQAAVDPNTIQGSSIDLSEIEKDLNATDLESLVADLGAI